MKIEPKTIQSKVYSNVKENISESLSGSKMDIDDISHIIQCWEKKFSNKRGVYFW